MGVGMGCNSWYIQSEMSWHSDRSCHWNSRGVLINQPPSCQSNTLTVATRPFYLHSCHLSFHRNNILSKNIHGDLSKTQFHGFLYELCCGTFLIEISWWILILFSPAHVKHLRHDNKFSAIKANTWTLQKILNQITKETDLKSLMVMDVDRNAQIKQDQKS